MNNAIFKADILDVLDELKHDVPGQVRLTYLDPPYNRGHAFHEYDDKFDSNEWVQFMTSVLEGVKSLLSEDGSVWVSIDDYEFAALFAVCVRVFGAGNFVANVVWQKRKTRENRSAFSSAHEYIVVFAKSKKAFAKSRNRLPLGEKALKAYRNPDDDPRGLWRSTPMTAQVARAGPNQQYDVVGPDGKKHNPPSRRCWSITKDRFEIERDDNRIYFGKDGKGAPRRKLYLSENKGLVPSTLWLADEVGTYSESKRQLKQDFDNEVPFDTPKPEALLERIISIASNEGDLVFDGFLGSGTTAVVADRMNRRWIVAEKGDHVHRCAIKRLRKAGVEFDFWEFG